MSTRSRIWRLHAATLGLLLIAAPAPRAAIAQLPRPEQIAAPDERGALARLLRLASAAGADRAAALPELDLILASLRAPTPLRGFVQYLRATILADEDRNREAREAIEEAIRLLPAHSGPLLFAVNLEAYDDRPGPAADYFLRAATIEPAIAREFDDFDLANLVARLEQHRERRRLRRLAERLFEIGWRGGDIGLRSSLASDLIRARHGEGNLAGARAMIPNLAAPQHAQRLLLDDRYRALWPDIETWTGPRQRLQWTLYLNELRVRWQASRDPSLAVPYVRALDMAGHYQTIIREMLPLFMGDLDRLEDYHLVWVASYLAGALARNGRWDDVDTMFERASRVWPLGLDANALNLAANRPRYRLVRGDAAAALAGIDAAIADAERWSGQVGASALAGMHQVRVCALHRLGRGEEALSSVAFVRTHAAPAMVSDMYLCLERTDDARIALTQGLSSESIRDEVFSHIQNGDAPPMQSDYGRTFHARQQALLRDPRLLAEFGRYGRLLPYSLRAGAPPEAAPQ